MIDDRAARLNVVSAHGAEDRRGLTRSHRDDRFVTMTALSSFFEESLSFASSFGFESSSSHRSSRVFSSSARASQTKYTSVSPVSPRRELNPSLLPSGDHTGILS